MSLARSTDPARRRRRIALRLTGVALLVSLLALVACGVLLARQAQQAHDSSERQQALNLRLRQLQAVLRGVIDAESGQRGYLLTGDRRLLRQHADAVAQLPAQLQSLDGLGAIAANDPTLPQRVAAMRVAVLRQVAVQAETIRLHDAGQADAALALLVAGAGVARPPIDAVVDTVRDRRDGVIAELADAGARIRALAWATVLALAACIVLTAAQIVMLSRQRLRYEAALAASERQHRAIVEDQNELISLAREDGTLTYVNPAYERSFGEPAAALLGRSLYHFVAPNDCEAVRATMQRLLDSGVAQHGENRMLNGDGSARWVEWTNTVQRGPGGERLLHSVGRDVTQRRATQDALRASEDFLARTGRLAGVGGWEVDLATNRVRWSGEVRRIHEVADDYEPTLESAIDFYAPEARAAIDDAVRTAAARGTPWDLELPIVTARGRRIAVRAIGETEFDAEGHAVRLVGAFQDITERKALRDRLAASERFVREITDNVPVRIAYVDRDGRYRFVNAEHMRRFGLAREQIVGRRRSELVGGANGAEVEAHLQAALAGRPQHFEFEEQRNGQVLAIQSQLIPDLDDDGTVRGLYTIGIDITALKATERRLRELGEILEHTPDLVVQTDAAGRIQYLNPAVRSAIGLAGDAPIGERRHTEFNTARTNVRYGAEIMPAVERDGVWIGESTVLVDQGRRVLPVSHMVIAHRDGEGRIVRHSAVMRDISQMVEARRALQRQSATLSAVIDAIPATVVVFDNDYRYRLVNRAYERWRGVGRDVVVGRTIGELFGQAEHDRNWPWAQRALAGETVHYENDYPGAAQQRHVSITYAPLRMPDGSVDGFIGVAQDVTVQRDETARLTTLSEHDPLTGVLNRAGFNAELKRRCDDGGGGMLALLYVDLDRFKAVNDNHGHAVGDKLLQQFAGRLRHQVRPTDAVSRLGGDEFAIILGGVRERAHAEIVADKVVAAASAPFAIDALLLSVGASVGVAFDASAAGGWQALVERADAKLYAAKAAGRGRRA